MLVNKKAVSTLILIILLLCSAVFGALLSYLWVMANYYNMPENTSMLITENAVFPNFPNLDFTYFNVTILNPSNSVSDVNVTAIQVIAESKSETYNVTVTEPEPLPFMIRRGTRQVFKCLSNWSKIAGENVTIRPITPSANISIVPYSCQTPNAKLSLQPTFDVEESVEYFNLTIVNSGTLNLTLSDIAVLGESIVNNVTPPLAAPYVLAPEQSATFKCNWSWDWGKIGIRNITITVKTSEGYEATYTTNELPGAYLYIDEINFDYSDTTYFNLTVSSSQYSNATIYLKNINLTLINEAPITLSTIPPLQIIPISILPNSSFTIKCLWNWNAYRNRTMEVSVYTKQGFSPQTKTETTPSDVVWNVTDVSFDLDYTNYFSVNVTNAPCSLREINVTQILLNGTAATIEPSPEKMLNGTQKMFNCSISWRDFIGKIANVTVVTSEGSISRLLEIPAVGLKILEEKPVYGDLYDPIINVTIPYINITISNSKGSLYDVTIVQIVLKTRNDMYLIYNNATYLHDNNVLYPQLRPEEYAPTGYPLKVGENVTFICSWNYESYLTPEPITVTIYTAEGFQASRTWTLNP
ncbi:MAG: hypothetical protein ACP5IM_05115 [Candidatus Bathyarchaeia archaeon]|nr:MAG: hypothetical protein C0195_02375 [Candidatus Bathyarchaeota archaeon]